MTRCRNVNRHILTAASMLLIMACGLPRIEAADELAADSSIRLAGETMGTRWEVRCLGKGVALRHNELQHGIAGVCESVNRTMSTWREDSEVSRFNVARTTDWFPVSIETARVVERSIEMSVFSEGAFDVTVDPLIRLWNFGTSALSRRIPDENAIANAMQRTGYQLLESDPNRSAIRKRQGDVSIDLSAIAKGFAVDQVAEYLQQAGISCWLVEIGGEVRTSGPKTDGSDWVIGIERPEFDSRSVGRLVPLSGLAMATSGDYRNSYTAPNGTRYSHTIDPRTGRPVTHSLASVTVVADTCMTADALATTLMVLGADAGYTFAEQHNIRAYFITRWNDEFRETATQDFPARIDTGLQQSQMDQSPTEHSPGKAAANQLAPVNNFVRRRFQEADSVKIFLVTLVVFIVSVIGMAVGVIIGNRRLRGSCGGLAGMQDDHGQTMCGACTAPSPDCRGVIANSTSTSGPGSGSLAPSRLDSKE